MNLQLLSLYNEEIELTFDIRKFNQLIVIPPDPENDNHNPFDFTVNNADRFKISDASLIVEYIVFDQEKDKEYLIVV